MQTAREFFKWGTALLALAMFTVGCEDSSSSNYDSDSVTTGSSPLKGTDKPADTQSDTVADTQSSAVPDTATQTVADTATTAVIDTATQTGADTTTATVTDTATATAVDTDSATATEAAPDTATVADTATEATGCVAIAPTVLPDVVVTPAMEYAAWLAQAESWPDWVVSTPPVREIEEYNDTDSEMVVVDTELYTAETLDENVRIGRTRYWEDIQAALGVARFIWENGAASELYPEWLLDICGLLPRARLDLLAAQCWAKLETTGVTEFEHEHHGEIEIHLLADEKADGMLEIYARQGYVQKMEETIAYIEQREAEEQAEREAADTEVDTETEEEIETTNDNAIQYAKLYMLTGQYARALGALDNIDDVTLYRREDRMASSTAGAASIAYRLGDYARVIALTQWMVDAGIDDTTFLPMTDEGEVDTDNRRYNYAIDQYQSSWKLAMQFREMAEANLMYPTENLTDGVYEVIAQGYRDSVKVTVTIAGGVIGDIAIEEGYGEGIYEDRPYGAFGALPELYVGGTTVLVDGISGATVTSGALEYGILNALHQACQ